MINGRDNCGSLNCICTRVIEWYSTKTGKDTVFLKSDYQQFDSLKNRDNRLLKLLWVEIA